MPSNFLCISKASALDVEGLDDYVEMVQALVDATSKPSKVTVLFELSDVERSHATVSTYATMPLARLHLQVVALLECRCRQWKFDG